MTEKLGFEQGLGNRRAVHLDQRHVALRAAMMNGPGDQLLAGSGLTGDQHRALRFGNALGAMDDVFHWTAAADDAVVVEVFIALAAQVAVFGAQPLMLEGPSYDNQELVDLEGLLQVVEGTQLHRLDGAFDGGMRRHHQNLRPLAFRCRTDQLANQIEAAQLRHDVVDDQDVEGALAEQPLCGSRAGAFDHLVPGIAQRPAECLENLFFVVDEQD